MLSIVPAYFANVVGVLSISEWKPSFEAWNPVYLGVTLLGGPLEAFGAGLGLLVFGAYLAYWILRVPRWTLVVPSVLFVAYSHFVLAAWKSR